MISNDSRTAKSIKNSTVSLVFYFVNIALGFVSRKVFIDNLGTEVLGLNTTATNLLQLLNLAELGIGIAIASSLYKPLAGKDWKQVGDIVSLQGWVYRRIAFVIGGGGVLLMCFFPWIFAKAELPAWYPYGAFGVLLMSSLLSYFITYKQIILTADQKEYKITYSYRAILLLRTVAQIGAVSFLNNGYVWWLILQLVFDFGAAFVLNLVIKKEYPQLRTELSRGNELRKRYPDITRKVKQVFFHKLAASVLTQTSPLILYAYASLSMVTLYGNYMLIVSGVTVLVSSMFNSMMASVGNLVAQCEPERVLRVFHELFSIRFLISATACFCVYSLTPSFITLWVGNEYQLGNMVLGLMTAILYLSLTRNVVDSCLNAYGLFHDIWAPVSETILNIGSSVLLGYFWGLPGILCGILLSLFVIVFLWKPYFLFSRGFKVSMSIYVGMYAKHTAAMAIVWGLTILLLSKVPLKASSSGLSFVGYSLLAALFFGGLLAAVLAMTNRGMRDFFSRMRYILNR